MGKRKAHLRNLANKRRRRHEEGEPDDEHVPEPEEDAHYMHGDGFSLS